MGKKSDEMPTRVTQSARKHDEALSRVPGHARNHYEVPSKVLPSGGGYVIQCLISFPYDEVAYRV